MAYTREPNQGEKSVGEAGQEVIRQIVQQTVAQRGWHFIEDLEGFADAIGAEMQFRRMLDPTEERRAVERAAIRRYSTMLYAGCCKNGSLQQRHAFAELQQYLARAAYYKLHDADLAAELTQQALCKIWKNLSKCREPGSFLHFGAVILLNEIRDYFRRRERDQATGEHTRSRGTITESDMENPQDPDQESEFQQMVDRTNDATEIVQKQEMRQEMLDRVQACLRNSQQARIIIGLFVEGKGYLELAAELRLKVNYVHVLRHRALERLRKCEALIQFFEDSFKD